MSKETASMREIQHNRQLIVQALNKNTTNFSNYSKISESLKEGNLKLTINPMTDEFLFQDSKNHTVCINPTKRTLNEKPIDELLLKADIDNKADKEYVDATRDYILAWTDRTYPQKHHTHNIYDVDELQEMLDDKADKTYVDNKMSSEVTRADKEYSKKTHTHTIANITNLQETLNKKSDVGHTHDFFATVGIENIAGTVEEPDGTGGDVLNWKPPNFPQGLTSEDDITTMKYIRCRNVYVMEDENKVKFTAQDLYDKKADKTYVNDELDKKADKTELQTLKTEILQTLYPIGSIYTSMNSTRPEVVLGLGTWTQIVDRFLYCANSSKETGGSKTISGENLPAHSHYIDLSTSQAGWHKHKFWDWHALKKGKGYDVKDDVQFAINCYWSDTQGDGNHTHRVTGYTQTTGQSKDYMPPYMTVYAWYRIA
ncbi:phage tail repeat-like family [Trichomonas vaginalis G3]|uniref:phage tail repeat-like family n=1 Tax=Trichomonas vaginalis (strain ATCC PRA-98 / G3) TaxID=412133 RepID=UPI0021E5F7B2|nr:phage tail repeat-like family [Trichomonas vaginalis G3]KAI5520511.1 phage tail repeat-like family [Trichomonas vaginalis G3]